MATANTPDSVPGLFKNVYEKSGLVNALPGWALLQDRFKFSDADATGDKYIMGVSLQYEHGASYGPSSGASTLLTLNAAVAGYIGKAEVEGYQIVMRCQLDYAAASKAKAKGEKAFGQAYQAVLSNLKESMSKRLELSLLRGQESLGEVASNSTGALTMEAADWSSAQWAGMKGAVLEAFDGQTASETQDDGDLTISGIDISGKIITVTGTSSAVDGNSYLSFKGARTASAYNECAGLLKILSNTGTLFALSATTHELWQSQQVNVGGAFNMSQVSDGVMKAVAFGLVGDAICFVNEDNFSELLKDEAALRVYDSQSSKAERGNEGIRYKIGPVTVEIVCHPFMPKSRAALVPAKKVKRIGSSDIVMGLSGMPEFALHVADKNAVELRLFSDQAIFLMCPAQGVNFHTIS